ncbi:hypothetical protein [Tianweitania sediminis]|uniref:Uncharacterized protein n=1 Tax=Tianweitania sediminis TaxID=1502156 RepID=A0A8J7UIV6_9HYPH|nr:hypothetical protein [Tianweitania sediminis]MBP0440644.1 hypothetical protein [Tianweitania sediminis]
MTIETVAREQQVHDAIKSKLKVRFYPYGVWTGRVEWEGIEEAARAAIAAMEGEAGGLCPQCGGMGYACTGCGGTGLAHPQLGERSPASEPEPAPGAGEICQTCQGNGEVVTNWERYLHGEPGDAGDEGTADCPDCDGIGRADGAGEDAEREAGLVERLRKPWREYQGGAEYLAVAAMLEAADRLEARTRQPTEPKPSQAGEPKQDAARYIALLQNCNTLEEQINVLAAKLRSRQLAPDAGPPFHFDRYVNGVLMAEGVIIERQKTLEAACVEAARLASKGPNGEPPVLVLRQLAPDADAQREALEETLRGLTTRIDNHLADLDKCGIKDGKKLNRVADLLNKIDEANFNAKAVLSQPGAGR